MNYFNLRDTIIGTGTGIVYGYALNKSGLLKSKVIRGQFEFKDFTLLKTFGTSIATGTLSVLAANSLGYSAVAVKPTYLWANLIGGAIVGASVYVTGSSPETAVAGVGAGKQRSMLLALGGFTGALTYGFIEKYLRNNILSETGNLVSVHTWLGVPFSYVAIPFVGLIAGGLYLLEQMYPTVTPLQEPITKTVTGNYILEDRWSPYLSGAIIGLTQLPISLFFNDIFGVTSTYAMIAAHLVGLLGTTTSFFELQKSASHFWLAPLHIGSALGSLYAESEKPKKEIKIKKEMTTKESITTVIGGATCILGTCIANGSVSAHGLSGVSQLSVGSILSTTSMFIGGVIAANLLSNS